MEYTWVITEDGRLKIMPHMHIGNNLHYQHVRLACGRKVYAAGGFTMQQDATITISLDSYNFQFGNNRWSGDNFASSDNGNVKDFVAFVFRFQGGARISGVDDNKEKQTFTFGQNDDFGSKNSSDYQSHQNDFSEKPFQEPVNIAKTLTWDTKTEEPLEFTEWGRKVGFMDLIDTARNKEEALHWAYYVTQTNAGMNIGAIKKQIRRLFGMFHEDKRPDNTAVQSLIGHAKSIIDAKYRTI